VSAARTELRAGVVVERSEVARMQRSYRQFRAELARMGVSTVAALVAERDAARAAAAESAAELDAAMSDRGAALARVAALTAERDAALRKLEECAAADDVRARLVALQGDVAVVSRRTELVASAASSPIADAIERKVATPLITPLARAYLRVLGFPTGSVPAGITWGLDTVPGDRLTASSVCHDCSTVHPGCRLLYPSGAVAGKGCFASKLYHPAGEWVRVDLGGERSVVGALVQSNEDSGASTEGGYHWHRHKFQWSADEATWTDVDGGRVWSRDGLARKDVSAAVFGAPVRCRYLRIVAVSTSGYLRWEVVVLP
jgi:hypothetical protein